MARRTIHRVHKRSCVDTTQATHLAYPGAADKEVFRRHASRAPLTVQQLDHVAKQLAA